MKKLSRNEVMSIELSILKEFDRFCRTHNLTYFLSDGTLLGAIRHGGFIPWDDDIDVTMPRSDYEKLYRLVKDGARCAYPIISYRDGSSIYQILKMVDPSTTTYENFVGKKYPQSVWIDIFPIERIWVDDPELKKVERKINNLLLKRSLTLADPSVGSSRAAKVAKRIGKLFTKNADVNKMNAEIDALASSISSDRPNSGNSIAWSCFATMPGLKHPDDVVFPVSSVSFEGLEFLAPAKPEKYLEIQYGDWKALPPEDKRYVHFPDVFKKDDKEIIDETAREKPMQKSC